MKVSSRPQGNHHERFSIHALGNNRPTFGLNGEVTSSVVMYEEKIEISKGSGVNILRIIDGKRKSLILFTDEGPLPEMTV